MNTLYYGDNLNILREYMMSGEVTSQTARSKRPAMPG